MSRQKKAPNRVDDLLDELLADDHSPEAVLGQNGILKQLSKRLVERALAGELNHHLKPDEDPTAVFVANSRNGSSKKTIQSESGELELSIPRDRNGSFDPVLVPKHQRRLAGLDEKIIALYARGMTTRDISAQLEELYGAKISASLISEVTDSVSEDVKAWQARPLDELYPIVYLDALYVNIKVSGRVSKRAVYVVLGIDREGNKQLLGLWIGEAESEGAKFWLQVLTELKNRGLKDILIACCDGLKGFPQAIAAVYPQTQVQLCIVHLMRNCMRYVPWKDRKAVIMEIRRVIYTTNAIESLNRSLRKVVKTKAVFPDEASVFKLMYLAMNNISKKWKRPIKDGCGSFRTKVGDFKKWLRASYRLLVRWKIRFSKNRKNSNLADLSFGRRGFGHKDTPFRHLLDLLNLNQSIIQKP